MHGSTNANVTEAAPSLRSEPQRTTLSFRIANLSRENEMSNPFEAIDGEALIFWAQHGRYRGFVFKSDIDGIKWCNFLRCLNGIQFNLTSPREQARR